MIRALALSISSSEVELMGHDGVAEHAGQHVLDRGAVAGDVAPDRLATGLLRRPCGRMRAVEVNGVLVVRWDDDDRPASDELESPLSGEEALVPDELGAHQMAPIERVPLIEPEAWAMTSPEAE